jgi:FtsZ-binding cell division protein ZapB
MIFEVLDHLEEQFDALLDTIISNLDIDSVSEEEKELIQHIEKYLISKEEQ